MKETAREMQNETSFSTDGSRAPASVKKKMDQNFAAFAGIFLPFPLAATNPARPDVAVPPALYRRNQCGL